MESVPAAGRDPERGEITEVCSFFRPTSKDVHDVVNYGGSVTFPRGRYVTYAIQLRPAICCRIVSPYIIKPLISVCAAEPEKVLACKSDAGRGKGRNPQIQLVIIRHNSMISSRRWHLALRATAVTGRNEHLPAIVGHLQLVEIKSRQVVHKVTLHLTTKDKNLGSKNIK